LADVDCRGITGDEAAFDKSPVMNSLWWIGRSPRGV